MTIVHDPRLEMEGAADEDEVGCGTIPFMAPECIFPSRFGLEKSAPTTEADIYAIGMVIYQVLTTQSLTRTRINSPV